MSYEMQARYAVLPNGIALNSLYIPAHKHPSGIALTGHFITGSSPSKKQALVDIYTHLAHYFHVGGAEETLYDHLLNGGSLNNNLRWEGVPLRDRNYYGQHQQLPIRTQTGVQVKIPSTGIHLSIYGDDYATGKIPWTIHELQQGDHMHEFDQMKEYFERPGGGPLEKLSWKDRYAQLA